MGSNFARTILDRVPINVTGVASVADDLAKTLVILLRVLDPAAGDELIEQLPHSHDVALRQIFADDLISLIDHATRAAMEIRHVETLLRHQVELGFWSMVEISKCGRGAANSRPIFLPLGGDDRLNFLLERAQPL